jgi:hypothetical protein
VTVVVVLAAVAVVLLVTHGSGSAKTPKAKRNTAPTAAGCALRVVETGFTFSPAYLMGVRDTADDEMVGGVIVENACRWAAVNTQFEVYGLNGAGEKISIGSDQWVSTFHIPLIMPGARVAFGVDYTMGNGFETVKPTELARLDVEYLENYPVCWRTVGGLATEDSARVTGITVGPHNADGYPADRIANISFAAAWAPSSTALGPADVPLIVRDRSGRLLFVDIATVPRSAASGQRQRTQIWADPDADFSRTGALVQPGVGSHDWSLVTGRYCLPT